MKRYRGTSNDDSDNDENDSKPSASVSVALPSVTLPTIDHTQYDSNHQNTIPKTTSSTTIKIEVSPSLANIKRGCLQTPHTMRLLKLIRDGTPEYANIAMERLETYCAAISTSSNSSSCGNNSIVILWDLIGRLQSFLNVAIWSTRQVSSYAIYMVVAHYIPYMDQYHFFTSTIPSSSVSAAVDPSKIPPTTDNSNVSDHHSVSTSSAIATKEYMTVQDLLEGTYSITNVLKYGQELYSVSESQFTRQAGTEQSHGYVNNNTVGTEPNVESNIDNKQFVTKRVQQQRQMLASRLGLGMIANVVASSNDDNIITDMIPDITKDDLLLLNPQQSLSHDETIRDHTQSTTNKRQKYAEQIYKASLAARQHDGENHHISNKNTSKGLSSSSSSSADAATTSSSSLQQYDIDVQDALDATSTPASSIDHPHTIRAMLVREVIQQQQQQQQENESPSPLPSSSINYKYNNNTNPQTLFGTELLYRMFHPVWYVRHGAILGILALLRAWVHTRTKHTTNSSGNDMNIFGTWLHDLLARCLCVIALDRFGDFGGNNNNDINLNQNETSSEIISNIRQRGMNSSEFSDHTLRSYSTWTNNSIGSSVVAPVREVCGQTIAILHALAPSMVAKQTRAVLFQLCEYKLSWEVRHGALIAFKYIIVVELTNMLQLHETVSLDATHQRTKQKDPNEAIVWIESICRMAMTCLSDPSDDVKSASAHLMIELCRNRCDKTNIRNEEMLFIWEVVSPLWSTLQKVRRFSSCIVDLVELCTILVARDCRSFLNNLHSRSLKNVKPKSDCESPSIYSLIGFLGSLLDSDFICVRTSALLSIGVVCDEFGSTHKMDMADDEEYGVACNTLHDLAIHILKLFVDKASYASIDTTDVDKKNSNDIMFGTWVRICNATLFIVKQNDLAKFDVTLLSWYFQIGEERVLHLSDIPIRLDAAQALAYYFSKTLLNGGISDVAQTMLLAYISSPWTTQVESVCLLHVELAKRLTDRISLQSLESRISLEVPMPCLTSTVWNMIASIDTLPVLCDQICLDTINQVIAGSKTPNTGAEDITMTWSEVFTKNQSTNTVPNHHLVCPITQMRLMAVIAGSILAQGVPAKLTPIMRALMTFFHNETTSTLRAELVATCFVKLLQLIIDEQKYSIARTKIFTTLCEATTNRARKRNVSNVCVALASSILQSVVKRIKSMRTLTDLTPIWQRIEPITRFDYVNSSPNILLLDGMDLLEVLLGGLSEKHILIKELIGTITPALIKLLLFGDDNAPRKRAASTVAAFCNVAPGCLLEVAIPYITRELADLSNDNRRLGACELLEKLVCSSATEICPFVRILLPHVLSLMSDIVVECSQFAASIFASLIKVAPLVQRSSCTIHDDNQKGSVIDHLIFGKSLPPCRLPIALINALRKNDITLRNYQQEGISWLQFLQSVNLNGALCDDMGTGKSLQALVAIALAHLVCTEGSTSSSSISSPSLLPVSLIVCPSTLVGHWATEIAKYFPSNSIFIPLCLEGGRTERIAMWQRKSNAVNIVITSYSVLRNDIDYLECEKWCYCVLDEGHLLKNPKTATSRASKRLKARHKIVLTGTLIQNRIHELWATFDFLMPSYLGTSKAFNVNYANPIAKSQLPSASSSAVAEGLSKLKMLHQQVLPFILRREKRQVLPELPQMSQTMIKVPMSALQQHMYRRFCEDRNVEISLESLDVVFTKTCTSGEGGGSDILKSLLFLRLLCTHPTLVLNELQLQSCPESMFAASASGKMLALVEILKGSLDYIDDAKGADNDMSVLYCDDETEDQDAYTNVLETPDPCLGENGINLSSPAAKCLIFAQFTKSLDALENLVFKTQMPTIRYCRLDGTIPPTQRMEVVNCFQNDPSVRVLLSTTRVGGVGLNLTSASTVIFFEVDFNPYADAQAQDRCMRIGQTQQVNVYKIITKDSIEESILTLQDKKMQVTEAIVNNENSTMYSMGTERLLDLFHIREQNSTDCSDTLEFDYDLEGVVEKCANDYKTLTVNTFTSNFLP